MLPRHQVATDSMTPIHVSPTRTVRVILIEQMILAILVHHTIRIVHPTPLWSKVINRTPQCLFVRSIITVGQRQVVAKNCILHFRTDTTPFQRIHSEAQHHMFACILRQFVRYCIIHLIDSQTHSKRLHLNIIYHHTDTYIRCRIFYRQNQILLCRINANHPMTIAKIHHFNITSYSKCCKGK